MRRLLLSALLVVVAGCSSTSSPHGTYPWEAPKDAAPQGYFVPPRPAMDPGLERMERDRKMMLQRPSFGAY